ncbi:MAG: hypothetical protein QQN63_10410, partial [Nitrosopumilus sp.]
EKTRCDFLEEHLDRQFRASLQGRVGPPVTSRLLARALILHALFEKGILPQAGGYDDQDPIDQTLMEITSRSYAKRQMIESKKRERRAGRK